MTSLTKFFPFVNLYNIGREGGGGVERVVYVHTHCGGRVSPANSEDTHIHIQLDIDTHS